MKITALIATFLLSVTFLTAQVAPDKYFIRFTDKNNSPYSIDNPSAYLSQRAIERRLHQGIAVEMSDIPVNPQYISGVAATGATILNPSKWLNGVSIYTTSAAVLAAIEDLPYVLSITKSPEQTENNEYTKYFQEKPFLKHETYQMPYAGIEKDGNATDAFDFGQGFNQIQMLGGDEFHQMGYRGQGMVIAVLDAGFLNAQNHVVFDSLWEDGRVLGTRDFVRGGEVQFDEHPHGSMVLSTMAGNDPGMLIGTAPLASYWLLRSEDGASEYIIEEYNWVSAAEYADSVGADIINSSLGYTEFNDPSQNHTYADMDGNTAPATIGADMAARKGILVVNSLGNEGSSSWYYLSAPSDGDSVMGIGAVDGSGIYASFSSHGPSYDGRIKPDVVAQGSGVFIADPYGGGYGYGGGTSFSSPILAGMAACLWQANPTMNNMQVAEAIRQSASQFNNPDPFLGHGIPDFIIANNLLTVINNPDNLDVNISVYPNPFNGKFVIEARSLNGSAAVDDFEGIGKVELMDLTGRTILSRDLDLKASPMVTFSGLEQMPAGFYLARISVANNSITIKMIKE